METTRISGERFHFKGRPPMSDDSRVPQQARKENPQLKVEANPTPGIPFVTDLQFWRNDPNWQSNKIFLLSQGARIVEGINVLDIRGASGSCSLLQNSLHSVKLVVVGGFHPH